MTFDALRLIAAALSALLAVAWLIWPDVVLGLWKMQTSKAELWAARRGGALFAGMAVILAGAHLSGSETLAVANGFAMACLLLASLGILAIFRHRAGSLLWGAVIVELGLAAAMSWLGHAG